MQNLWKIQSNSYLYRLDSEVQKVIFKKLSSVIFKKIIFMVRVYGDSDPAGICMFKVNKRNTRTRCKICSKLTTKISERRQWRRSGIFIVNFEHISHLVLVFLLLTLTRLIPDGELF